ncbi:bifunctional DNA primase/polymerase [Pseudomonas sp. NPDC086581]|uniref:bifunctional DNA primase/polymerase n=1 Tax=Pseudomonas sp. NPDC086581 TaxID=3364432 RepID=UPI00380FB8C1
MRLTPIAEAACRYIRDFGLAPVMIPPGNKGPTGYGWNKPGGYFTDAEAAGQFWTEHPTHNLGVVLAPSGVCSLDVDDVPAARQVLWEVLGVDLDALQLHFPTVVGNPARCRLMFRVPEGVELGAHKLTWPNREDPDGSKFRAANQRKASAKKRAEVARKTSDGPAESEALAEMEAAQAEVKAVAPFTVLELRAGDVQDVLPPSIHPDTGQPYTWRTPLPEVGPIPELPVDLLRGWQNWDIVKRDGLACCEWAVKPSAPMKAKPVKRPKPAAGEGESPVDAFNRAHDVEQLLEARGYERKGMKWLCPGSTSGIAGITIVEGTVFSHHGSDPLCNGHRNDAFDVFRILDHGGDHNAAVRAAARLLGIARPGRERPPPEPGTNASRPGAPPAPPPDAPPPVSAPPDDDGGSAHPLGGVGGFRITEQELIEDFVVIYGSDVAWDAKRSKMIKLTAIREAVGRTRYKWWQENELRRMAQDVVFDPTRRCGELVLNLFDGFQMEPDARGEEGCKLIRSHLYMLCGERAEEYWFLLKWIAYPLQFPGAKMDTAVVMFGEEGPGKSVIWEKVVRRIYGKYATVIGQAQLESQFTGWQSQKLFALAEEVVSREEMRHYKGVLKHLVTGETLQVNEKNMPVREESNHLNFVFLSNSTVPLALDNGDRRYLVLYVDRVLPPDYFRELFVEIGSGGVEAFYQYLMDLDLTGFDPHVKPPLNEEKQGLIDGSLAAPRYFVRRWLAGETDFPLTGAVTQADLWQAFTRWCEGANEFKRRERDFHQEVARDLARDRHDIRYPSDKDECRTTRMYVTKEFAARRKELGKRFASHAGLECRKFGAHFERRTLPPAGAFA